MGQFFVESREQRFWTRSIMVVGGGRRADGAIPPAHYRRAAGVPGENARIAALAVLILKLRQR